MEAKLAYKSMSSGKIQCRGTLVWNELTKNAVLIDPTDDATPFLQFIKGHELDVKALLLTHAHVDHAASVCNVGRQLGLTPKLHPADLPIFYDIPKHGPSFGIIVDKMDLEPSPLRHGEVIDIEEGFKIQVLHVPGHTPGSVTFYIQDIHLAVVGDTLFYGSVGRSDLPGGSHHALMNSIQSILYRLPPETIVIPGHGPKTSIGHESQHNPYVRAK